MLVLVVQARGSNSSPTGSAQANTFANSCFAGSYSNDKCVQALVTAAAVAAVTAIVGTAGYALYSNWRANNPMVTQAEQQTQVQKCMDAASAAVRAQEDSIPSMATNAQIAAEYPVQWHDAFTNAAVDWMSTGIGLQPTNFLDFIRKWQISLGGVSCDEALAAIETAISTGGGPTSIGKFEVPSSYVNTLDYMQQNDITSPQLVAEVNMYMSAASASAAGNRLPYVYTQGMEPPTPSPTSGINMGGAGGTTGNTAYDASYNQMKQLLQSIKGSPEVLSAQLQAEYQSSSSRLAEIYESIENHESTFEENEAEISKIQGEIAAENDGYKSVNNGEDIPGYKNPMSIPETLPMG